ncbi:hypothetical protein AK812_SmicGene23408 [Symbiodinium microadriaticum]|uniref:Uncharacterized protein n=1 Tax=Symbiodinium microadriaticum TaxID=2951 RepID=A0A1Q9DHC4_SYMMI|nr:hypothetical protein AK812_SmicGene23408 [Symbiodinium microadriaticum]
MLLKAHFVEKAVLAGAWLNVSSPEILQRMAAAQSSGVRDVLRSALAFDDYNGLLEAIHFINQVDVKAVIQKNRFSSPARGWRDVLFLEFSSGIASKFQTPAEIVRLLQEVASSEAMRERAAAVKEECRKFSGEHAFVEFIREKALMPA